MTYEMTRATPPRTEKKESQTDANSRAVGIPGEGCHCRYNDIMRQENTSHENINQTDERHNIDKTYNRNAKGENATPSRPLSRRRNSEKSTNKRMSCFVLFQLGIMVGRATASAQRFVVFPKTKLTQNAG